MAFVKRVTYEKREIDPSDRPTRDEKYAIFQGEGPATDDDVIAAFGIAYVEYLTYQYTVGDKWHFTNHCYWIGEMPVNAARAKLKAYAYLRDLIDSQRKMFSAKRKLAESYTGDPNSPSPLNPNRKRRPDDFEDSFDLLGTDRELNPFIL